MFEGGAKLTVFDGLVVWLAIEQVSPLRSVCTSTEFAWTGVGVVGTTKPDFSITDSKSATLFFNEVPISRRDDMSIKALNSSTLLDIILLISSIRGLSEAGSGIPFATQALQRTYHVRPSLVLRSRIGISSGSKLEQVM